MSQVFSKSIRLRGDAVTLFDQARTFILSRGFSVLKEERPFTIVADRGSLRPTNNIQKRSHTLNIAIHPANEGITMSFIYLMSDFWHYTPCDQMFFNNEIEMFVRNLVVDGMSMDKPLGPAVYNDVAYIGELRELAKLKNEGVVTAEEFEQKKRKLLGI
jgi:hypothetical protein